MLVELEDVVAFLNVLASKEGCGFVSISIKKKTARFVAQEREFDIPFTHASTADEVRNALIVGSFRAVTTNHVRL